jgi:hypothetical protein
LSTTRSLVSQPKSRSLRTLQYRATICTRVALSTSDLANPPIPSQRLRPKGNRSQQSLSPRVSFCGPVVQAVGHLSSPVALRNRDLYPHLQLQHNLGQYLLLHQLQYSNPGQSLSRWQHCQMAQVTHAPHQQAGYLLRHHRLVRPQHHLHQRSPRTRLYTTLRDNRLES